MEEARVEKKKLEDQINALFGQKETLQVEIYDLRIYLGNCHKFCKIIKSLKKSIIFKEKSEILNNVDLNNQILSQKEDYNNQIDYLNVERKKLYEIFQKECDDYYEQQKLIKKTMWMTNIKNRLQSEQTTREKLKDH